MLGGILLVVVVVFVLENTRSVKVRLLIPEVTAPLAVPIVIAAVLGALIAALLRYRRERRRAKATPNQPGDEGRADALEAGPRVDPRDGVIARRQEHRPRTVPPRVRDEAGSDRQAGAEPAGARQRADADDLGHRAHRIVLAGGDQLPAR